MLSINESSKGQSGGTKLSEDDALRLSMETFHSAAGRRTVVAGPGGSFSLTVGTGGT